MQTIFGSFLPGDHQEVAVSNVLDESPSHQLYEQRLGAEDLQQENADGLHSSEEFAEISDQVWQKRKRNCRDCDETEEASSAKNAKVDQSMTPGTTYTTFPSSSSSSPSSSPSLFTSCEQVCPNPPPNGSFEMRNA